MLTFPMVIPQGDYRMISRPRRTQAPTLYITTSAIARKEEVEPTFYAGPTALSVHPIQEGHGGDIDLLYLESGVYCTLVIGICCLLTCKDLANAS